MSRTVLILGAGNVGSALAAGALAERYEVVVTRRSHAALGPGGSPLPGARAVVFDASDRATWDSLPAGASHVVWTFAAGQGSLSLFRWLTGTRYPGAAVAVYSSTSCYVVDAPDAEIDEATRLDLSQARFAAEEGMRLGDATILALSGLFGRGRDPARWVERGLVKNGDALVNLVHSDDVARATLAWMRAPCRGERVNVSTACLRWHALVGALVEAGRLPAGTTLPALGPSITSKRVSAAKLARLYPDFARIAPYDVRGVFP